MPTFKSKNFKKLSSDPNLESLDFKHEEFLSDFNTNEKEKIPNLYKKREDLLNKYNSTDILEEKLDLKDTIKNIDQEIKSLKTSKKQYLLNNSEHIFNYFENKKKYLLEYQILKD